MDLALQMDKLAVRSDTACPSPSQGACFGFEIHSSLAFHYLREGQGRHDLRIVTIPDYSRLLAGGQVGKELIEWLPRPGHPFHARLYQGLADYQLWIENFGWFLINPKDACIGVPEGVDEVRREEHLWGIPAALCLLHRHDLPLHAAAVRVGTGAVLLAAPGRFGKTTLAAAFLQRRYRILAEDLSCLRLDPEPSVVPGPAVLRVRRDVLAQLSLPCVTIVGEYGERVSFSIDRSMRGDCTPVPLRAIVLLREGPRHSLERIGAPAALRELWALSFRLPTDDDRRRCFAMLTGLTISVPTWWLSRPLRSESLSETVETIRGLVQAMQVNLSNDELTRQARRP